MGWRHILGFSECVDADWTRLSVLAADFSLVMNASDAMLPNVVFVMCLSCETFAADSLFAVRKALFTFCCLVTKLIKLSTSVFYPLYIAHIGSVVVLWMQNCTNSFCFC